MRVARGILVVGIVSGCSLEWTLQQAPIDDDDLDASSPSMLDVEEAGSKDRTKVVSDSATDHSTEALEAGEAAAAESDADAESDAEPEAGDDGGGDADAGAAGEGDADAAGEGDADAAGEGDADASGDCVPSRCDCDNDGYNDLTRPGCENAGGPHDCDDHDPRVRPNQTFLEDAPVPPRNGDWNCNGSVEKLYPSNVSCGLLALTGCAGVQGFSGAPACGAAGEHVFCEVKLGLLCGEGEKSTRTQACK